MEAYVQSYVIRSHIDVLVDNKIFYLFWTDLSLLDYLYLLFVERIVLGVIINSIIICSINSISETASNILGVFFKNMYFGGLYYSALYLTYVTVCFFFFIIYNLI